MINQVTKDKIESLRQHYLSLSIGKADILREIATTEIPEMVYNSNAIENSTLTLEDTEDILIRNQISKDHDIREIYEAKNLAQITEKLLDHPSEKLSISLILDLHRILLTGIRDDWAGRFRSGREWVRIGTHMGANPEFTSGLMHDLVSKYSEETDEYFLDKIAHFHAEFELIHPFNDGNGRMGRVLINQQLGVLGLPTITIQNKSKFNDYYPLFNEYSKTNKYDGFTELFALLLLESLNKRIARLSARRIISLSRWAKNNNVRANLVLNQAKRQTIPAFRMNEKWMIDEDFILSI